MKKIFLSLTLFLFVSSVFSQVIVEKSTDIVLVLGRKYYIHTVKTGETLYSIGRVYEVPQEQVILINKEKVVNLLAGDVLRIPIIDDDYEAVVNETVTFIQHKVARNESLYSISKKYKVSEEMIIKYNPEADKKLKKGTILKIPEIKKVTIQAQDEFFIYHQVVGNESLFSIAEKYKVTQKQILQVNPEADQELKFGQILSIPKREFTEKELLIIKGEISDLPNLLNIDPLYFTDPSCLPCKDFVYDEEQSFKVALLMPFYLNLNYSRSYDMASNPKNASFHRNTEVFFEFYEGFLLAINDLRELGLSIDLFVYDTQNDSAVVQAIFDKYEMRNMDLIIGPVYSANFNIAAKFANENRINIVSPISKNNSILTENPFFFQVNPSEEILLANTAKSLETYYDSTIIVVHNNSEKEQELVQTFRNNLVKSFLNETEVDSVNFTEIFYNKQGKKALKSSLKKYQTNIVVIPSSNEVFISNILNYLNTLVSIEKYQITVYGMPSWENFQDLELIFYENLNIHYPSPSFMNENDWQVAQFNNDYLESFNREPSVFSYQGYDIAYYFISALKRYGKYFQFCISQHDVEPNPQGLSLMFNFKRIDEHSGFENNNVHIIRFDENLNKVKANNN